jgi:hypothetical protein
MALTRRDALMLLAGALPLAGRAQGIEQPRIL